MDLTELLKGKKIKYMTDARVEVVLEILSVEEKHNSRDLEPSGPHNDWWPKSEEWKTYPVKFTTGFVKSYGSVNEILSKVVE